MIIMPSNDKTFNQYKYMNDWKKDNMSHVGAQYKKDFVDEFKIACKGLGISQSEVIRKAMEETIERYKNQK